MNMVTIVCPKCGAEGKLSLVDSSYVGPRRCWKCHELFAITIYNNEVRSSEPLSQEEYDRQQETKNTKAKLGNSIQTSSREEPEIPQITPERRRDYTKPLSYGGSSSQKEPERLVPHNPPDKFQTFTPLEKSQDKPEKPASKTPPDRFQTFVPLEDTYEEPERPAPKTPPDRFRTFIPPAT
jgi:hypothetical protein